MRMYVRTHGTTAAARTAREVLALGCD
jgi:hypothetical protein